MTLADILRWAARLTGSFVVGLVLVMVFQTDAATMDLGEPAVIIQLLCLIGLVLGVMIGWRNEALGGWVFPFMILPGLLFKASHWVRGRQRG